jgi:hypothetical protein
MHGHSVNHDDQGSSHLVKTGRLEFCLVLDKLTIFYSTLVDSIRSKIVVQHVCFVKGRGHVVARKEMLKLC